MSCPFECAFVACLPSFHDLGVFLLNGTSCGTDIFENMIVSAFAICLKQPFLCSRID